MSDIQKTNQSKYVSEAAAAISEAPLKSKDINAAVQICSALHQRYPDFQAELVPALAKSCTPRTGIITVCDSFHKVIPDNQAVTCLANVLLRNASLHVCVHHAIMALCNTADDDKSSSIKRRSAFRLLSELLLVGVYSDASVLLGVVKHLAVFDFQRDRDVAQGSLSVLASFAKSCRQDVLGLGQQLLPALTAGEPDQASAQLGAAPAMALHLLITWHLGDVIGSPACIRCQK